MSERTQKLWLVYSREHNSFWKPDECGYTNVISEAGRYTRDKAFRICDMANRGLGIREQNEVAVVSPEAIEQLDRMGEVLKGYEQWEADVVMDDNCWRDSPMVLTQKQYDRLIELQQLRNAVLLPEPPHPHLSEPDTEFPQTRGVQS